MEKISKNVRKVVDKIRKLYGESPDLNTRIIDIQGQKIGCLFFESSSQTSTISDFIIKAVDYTKDNLFDSLFDSSKK